MICPNPYDLKIHKILKEAKDEECRRRILLLMGRGNGKTRLLEDELEHFITSSKPEPVKLSKSNIELIKETVIDRDMEDYLMSPYRDWVDKCIEEERRKFLREDRPTWKPKIYISTTGLPDADRALRWIYDEFNLA